MMRRKIVTEVVRLRLSRLILGYTTSKFPLPHDRRARPVLSKRETG